MGIYQKKLCIVSLSRSEEKRRSLESNAFIDTSSAKITPRAVNYYQYCSFDKLHPKPFYPYKVASCVCQCNSMLSFPLYNHLTNSEGRKWLLYVFFNVNSLTQAADCQFDTETIKIGPARNRSLENKCSENSSARLAPGLLQLACSFTRFAPLLLQWDGGICSDCGLDHHVHPQEPRWFCWVVAAF